MAEENDPNKTLDPGTADVADRAALPACGRGCELAGDVLDEVMEVCPRCTDTGPACLIELMHTAAFPSRRQH